MRTIYTKSVITVAKKIELGISINPSGEEHPAVPFPATFARLVNEKFRKGSNLSVDIISEHPVNPVQKLNSDVDREANNHLKNSENKMFSKVVERSGKLYVLMYTADRAAAQACVSCHTQLMGKAFKINDLLGIRKYEMIFSSDLEIGREEIHPKLDEYEKAKKIFSQTLSAFKNGGSYPLDLNLTKFKKTEPVSFKKVKNSIKNIEYSYKIFITSVDRLLNSQVNSLDYRIAQNEILKNSNDLRSKSNELVSIFTEIASINQKNIRSIVMYSSVLTLIILFMLGFYLLTFVIKPIQKLTGVLGQIKDGNFNVKTLPVKSSDEIGSLNDACNKMVVNMNLLVDQAKDIEEGKLNSTKVLESLDQGKGFDEASNFVEVKYQVTHGTLAEAFDDLTTKMRKLAVQAIAISEDNLDSPVLKEKFSGDLGTAFTNMIEKMNETATQAKYIANNDLHNKDLKSEGTGTLTGSMSTMVKNLR
jgi:methyl-accepting chemotaxis protein